MAGKRDNGNPMPVSDLAMAVIDPLLRRRAGISVELVQSWDEIVGQRLAATSRPEKIAWPRRLSEDDPFEPATLVIACEGLAALHLQHETGEVISRVNAFLGFAAVERVKIVQKKVAAPAKPRPRTRPLTGMEAARVDAMVSSLDEGDLRDALARLGRSVIGGR